MTHIAIIGAGITGVTTAYALLERGFEVTVLDQHRYAAMETSFANGGQLSASNAEVWNSTATILKGLRWMFRRDAPLLMNPRPNWHKYSWMSEFVANIGNYRANTVQTTLLAIEARKHLCEVATREGIDFDLERRGILHVYHDKKGFESGLRVNALLREGGLDRRPVTPEEIRAIEPTLRKASPARPSSTTSTATSAPTACSRWSIGCAAIFRRSRPRGSSHGPGCGR